jgi:hypothetical protein
MSMPAGISDDHRSQMSETKPIGAKASYVPSFGLLLLSAPELSDLPPRDQTPARVPEF